MKIMINYDWTFTSGGLVNSYTTSTSGLVRTIIQDRYKVARSYTRHKASGGVVRRTVGKL